MRYIIFASIIVMMKAFYKLETLMLLINAGLNINQQNTEGNSPLMTLLLNLGKSLFKTEHITIEHITESVKLLIKNGANLNFVNKSNLTALNILLKGRQELYDRYITYQGSNDLTLFFKELLHNKFITDLQFYNSLVEFLQDNGAKFAAELK